MVDALPLEESLKLLHCEGGIIVSIQDTRGGLYWDIASWSFWTRAWADFKVMWNRKGYLLNRYAISRQSLLLWLK